MEKNLIYKLKVAMLMIFVIALPFENWDPFGISSFFSVTKMAGVLYALFALMSIKHSFDMKISFPAVKIMLLLWFWVGLQSVFNYWVGTKFPIFNITLLQNIILFWLITSDLIKNPKLFKYLYLAFIFGVLLMTSLASTGVGISLEYEYGLAGEARLSFFGANPNVIGNFCSLSLILVAYLIMNNDRYFGKFSLLLLATVPTTLTIIGLSGSRGALGLVLVGLVGLFIVYKTSMMKKIIIMFVGVFALVFAVDKVLESDIMQRRLQKTFEEDDIGGRDRLWGNALEIFYDSPLFGSGSTGFERKSLLMFGEFNDTHNVFLYFLVTGGVIALFIYLLFLHKVFKSAWFVYKNQNETIMLVLLFIYLFAGFKSGGFINDKFMWFTISIVYASRYGLKTSEGNLTLMQQT